jgi:UDP-N-acetylglucosamine kinase
MTDEEIIAKEKAKKFARENKGQIAKVRTDTGIYLPDEFPVSVFMAGSPGAGKTESSRNLIKKLSDDNHSVLRIDSDELRSEFQEYNGANSSLFILATSIIADKMHDFALKNKQSFVFDGTLSNIDRSRENIKRSLSKNRFVQIVYVYQEPLQAWSFVKAREVKDGRRIPKEAFIMEYFQARENGNILKREFGVNIKVDLVIKNIDGTDFGYHENIDVIDNYIPEKYTKDSLNGLII